MQEFCDKVQPLHHKSMMKDMLSVMGNKLYSYRKAPGNQQASSQCHYRSNSLANTLHNFYLFLRVEAS